MCFSSPQCVLLTVFRFHFRNSLCSSVIPSACCVTATKNFCVSVCYEMRSLLFADTDNQRVIIHVKDVNDEPPYFINRPLPMQAVVQLNAPPNTPVFTLQARDPDTDHNIHYFIVRDRSKYLVLATLD